jgi:NAD+ kinase
LKKFEKGRRINILYNDNLDSKKVFNLLKIKLNENGFLVSEDYNSQAELNICIGGDGAFLRSVHKYNFPNIPFIGVNTGHLGFYQEILPEDIDTFIEKYMKKEYFTEKIYLIESKILIDKKIIKLLGINEIVVKGTASKVVHLEIFIDNNHLEMFSGDGIIISTPMGSTAYNFSSGGSIVYPLLKALQITPLSPISSKAYRSLPNSAVIPGNMTITVKPEFKYENSILIMNDGVENRYDNITEINLTMSKKKIYKLNFDKDMYWNNLKSKFL